MLPIIKTVRACVPDLASRLHDAFTGETADFAPKDITLALGFGTTSGLEAEKDWEGDELDEHAAPSSTSDNLKAGEYNVGRVSEVADAIQSRGCKSRSSK